MFLNLCSQFGNTTINNNIIIIIIIIINITIIIVVIIYSHIYKSKMAKSCMPLQTSTEKTDFFLLQLK